MTYSILPEARVEFKKAFAHYESKRQGLGVEFSDEFYTSLDRILSLPQAWTEIEPSVRRCLTQKFPYSILYHFIEDKQKIVIVAIMHQHQKPEYWKTRKF